MALSSWGTRREWACPGHESPQRHGGDGAGRPPTGEKRRQAGLVCLFTDPMIRSVKPETFSSTACVVWRELWGCKCVCVKSFGLMLQCVEEGGGGPLGSRTKASTSRSRWRGCNTESAWESRAVCLQARYSSAPDTPFRMRLEPVHNATQRNAHPAAPALPRQRAHGKRCGEW